MAIADLLYIRVSGALSFREVEALRCERDHLGRPAIVGFPALGDQ